MTDVPEPRSDSLRAMFWRDEILQVMFWLSGEGLGDRIDAELLERFLGVQASVGVRYLDRLVEEAYLTKDADGLYALTDHGRQFGGQLFSEEFAELTRPSHGECGSDCWCHASPEEAEACLAERIGHDHG